MAEFPHIARQYYWNAQQAQGLGSGSSSGPVDVAMGVANPGIVDNNMVCHMWCLVLFDSVGLD
jgi:hypothetical protein